MTETFLYSVKPRRPIQLDGGSVIIKTPKSLLLTKEDVLTCIDKGAIVYRRFANEDKLEPVTKYNLDRLHNNKFMTEDEYAKAEKDELGKDSGTVSIAEPEPVKVEEKVEEPVITEPEKVEEPVETEAPVVGTPVEEVVEEAPVVEEEVKEVVADETESSEDTSEVSEVESDETVAEVDQVSGSDAVEESESKEDSNNQFKNYKKKKNK